MKPIANKTMKITICGSAKFIERMKEVRGELESLGHEVKLPPLEIENEAGEMIPVTEYYALRHAEADAEPADDSWIWKRKGEEIHKHFAKIEWADVVLVVNEEKNEIPGYIGANTLIEMGLAFHLGKKIYLIRQIPDISYKEEILAMVPDVLHGDPSLIC